MHLSKLITVTSVALMGVAGMTTPSQAASRTKRTKLVKVSRKNYFSTSKTGKTYRFTGSAKRLTLKTSHALKNYTKSTWIRSKKTTVTIHGKKHLYYFVTNSNRKASGWVAASLLKAGKNYQSTKVTKTKATKYYRAKAGKLTKISGKSSYVKLSNGATLKSNLTYVKSQQKYVYVHGKKVRYDYVKSVNGKSKGWVKAGTLKAGRDYQMTTPKKFKSRAVIRAKAGKVYVLSGNNNLFKLGKSTALNNKDNYTAIESRYLYKKNKKALYYHISNTDGSVTGWVLASALKTGKHVSAPTTPVKNPDKSNSSSSSTSSVVASSEPSQTSASSSSEATAVTSSASSEAAANSSSESTAVTSSASSEAAANSSSESSAVTSSSSSEAAASSSSESSAVTSSSSSEAAASSSSESSAVASSSSSEAAASSSSESSAVTSSSSSETAASSSSESSAVASSSSSETAASSSSESSTVTSSSSSEAAASSSSESTTVDSSSSSETTNPTVDDPFTGKAVHTIYTSTNAYLYTTKDLTTISQTPLQGDTSVIAYPDGITTALTGKNAGALAIPVTYKGQNLYFKGTFKGLTANGLYPDGYYYALGDTTFYGVVKPTDPSVKLDAPFLNGSTWFYSFDGGSTIYSYQDGVWSGETFPNAQ